MRTIATGLGLGITLMLLSSASFAQSPPPAAMPAMMAPPVSGTIKAAAPDQLTVTTSDGKDVNVPLHPNTRISVITKKTLADIHQGDFVGSAAMMGADGKLRAQEVHIISERGLGEGHRPMGADPNRSMTNATVAEVASDPKGETLVMKYPGGEQNIIVTPETPVMAMQPADPTLLKPGTPVNIMMMKDDKGATFARAVMVNKDGIKMP